MQKDSTSTTRAGATRHLALKAPPGVSSRRNGVQVGGTSTVHRRARADGLSRVASCGSRAVAPSGWPFRSDSNNHCAKPLARSSPIGISVPITPAAPRSLTMKGARIQILDPSLWARRESERGSYIELALAWPPPEASWSSRSTIWCFGGCFSSFALRVRSNECRDLEIVVLRHEGDTRRITSPS